MELTAVAARVLGCLLEKARTTPDQYPLSLNALVAACNQTTNRWPVVRYDEETVEAGLDELRALELIRREKPHGSRAIKYSESVTRVIPLDGAGLALLTVLLLRGPQTPGELKARTERLHRFEDLASLDEALSGLVRHEDGPLVTQLPREPGRKEARWRDTLQPAAADVDADSVAGSAAARVSEVTPRDLAARVEVLEAEVGRLRAEVEAMVSRPEH
jgi:uncharacterized protein YceH (UPF0502 family)